MTDRELELSIANAIHNGLQARSQGRASGCGRAYVCLSKLPDKAQDRKTLAAFKKACAAVGVRYLDKAYGTGSRAVYIGYDNADGRALAQAKAIEQNLKELGLPVYWDAVAD